MNRRVQKMGSLIRAELARVLLEEISDPGLREVVINDVELSKDLKYARVFFTLAANSTIKPNEVDKGFQRAQTYLKKRVADNLQLRFVPALEFVQDDHTESVTRLYGILDEVANQEKSDPVRLGSGKE